jgi:ABC-2 type transport system permease protein
MNRFLTLVRKDLADYRGALIWTPFVVAAIILVLSLFAVIAGRFEPGFDLEGVTQSEATQPGAGGSASGAVTIEREDGKQVRVDLDPEGEPRIRMLDGDVIVDGVTTPEERVTVRKAAAVAPAVGAALPIGIAAVVILFVLLGALYDERKDRSILFWKSMPASDLETVLSKAVAIGALGLGAALAAGLVTYVGLTVLTFGKLAGHGFGFVGLDTLGIIVQVWSLIASTTAVYLLWVLPVYAWLLFASAVSPKAPITVGLVPLTLLPLAAEVVGLSSDWLMEPLARLIGHPMGQSFGDYLDGGPVTSGSAIDIAPAFAALGQSFTQPGLWIGLLVAAGLLYATAEVRRRKAL